ncbi:MAG: Peptide chain release factor 2, partial [Thermovirga lienii]
MTGEQGFWDRDDAQELTKKLALLQDRYSKWQEMENELKEIETIAELLAMEQDEALEKEFYERAEKLKKRIEEEQVMLLLDEEYDESNAIVSIHPGAGGLDSQDWAEILYRMYLRWAENKGFKTKVLEISQGEEAGIPSDVDLSSRKLRKILSYADHLNVEKV